MVSDSITNASIPIAAPNAKDWVKKKRANRSAKLKQCKLDARREQWLSQVKNKDNKAESDPHRELSVPPIYARNERDKSMKNLDIKPGGEGNDGSTHHFSDSDLPSNSPTSHTSSVLGGNDSGTNFTGSSSRSSSSSSSSGWCCSEEDEGGDDECLDDWEAIADSLAETDIKEDEHNPRSEPFEQHESIAQFDSPPELLNQSASGTEKPKPKSECRAWRPDDAFRPQSLPNLSKQHSFPMNSDRHCGCGGAMCGCKNFLPAPSSCPICYEDLDVTDSSFLPCSCGFRLCLFCHKRIIEEDGRCPGCRKQYDCDSIKGELTLDGGGLKLRLARSYSMITKS